jgi:hypothetical protein
MRLISNKENLLIHTLFKSKMIESPYEIIKKNMVKFDGHS